MDERLGFVGILLENRTRNSAPVNRILSEHGDGILARTGIPNVDGTRCVITLVVRMSTDAVGRLTGQLGALDGVQVKSGLLTAGGGPG